MSFKFYLFFLTCAFLIGVSSADIFGDFFKWDLMSALTGGDEEDEKQAKQDDDNTSASTCDCHGARCNCCVDFNISNIIDFGGPGCVIMKYLSESEGISLNVSYGDRVLHSQKIVDEKKQGACMPLLSQFAQFCARFSELTKVEGGMTGCLNFEPTVLGEATAQYFVGCFRMSPNMMILDDSLHNSTDTDDSEEIETSSKKPEDDSQSFLDVVNQSAQEGIEFFSSLLGIDVGGKKKNKNTSTEKPPETEESSSRRKGKFDILENLS